jgi:hypothetical protein
MAAEGRHKAQSLTEKVVCVMEVTLVLEAAGSKKER